MATEELQATTDAGARLLKDIGAHALRLAKIPPTLENLSSEMSGTVLEFVKDVLSQHLELRDWVYENLTVLDERVGALEEDETRILPEDAEKLLSFIEGTKILIERNLEAPLAADVKKGLEELRRLGDECQEIVEDSTMEDEEDETDDPDGAGAQAGAPAAG